MNSDIAGETRTVLGDSHFGRSTELIIIGGEKVIRKYRSADTEKALESFLSKLRALGFDLLFSSPRVCAEDDGYHDERFVENTPTDTAGIHRYYRRCGALLLFSLVFGSTDLHAENLIACGDTPVVIDLETLLGGTPTADASKENIASRTVMGSHLLANFINQGGRTLDCSGLTGVTADEINIPKDDSGRHSYAWEHPDAVTDGFLDTGQKVIENTAEICSALDIFGSCRFRAILRPTATYRAISEYLAGIEPDKREQTAKTLLSRAYLRDSDPDKINKAALILADEIRAVMSGDVPLFHTRGDSTELLCGDTVVYRDFLLQTPIVKVKQRLSALTMPYLADQCRIITQALSACAPLSEVHSVPSVHTKKDISADLAIRVIADRLDGAATMLPSVWTHLGCDSRGNAYYESCDFGVYDGVVGILCFYAAAYSCTGDRRYLDSLLCYAQRFAENSIGESNCFSLTDGNCSLQGGIGGAVSAMLHIYDLSGEQVFYSYAERLLASLDPDRVNITDTDVLTGAGGLALALPKLGGGKSLRLAQVLAGVFESAQTELTGLAHGAAGLALSLGALQRVLGDSRFDERIIELLQRENSFFSTERLNWMDMREPEKKGYMSGWCSGAPGIGMARQRLLEYTNNETIRQICTRDIEYAKDFLSAETPTHRDTLCCGAASRLLAAGRLGVTLPDTAARLAERSCLGSLRVYHLLDTSDLCPGLMQGIAGAGYALAMQADKKSGDILL